MFFPNGAKEKIKIESNENLMLTCKKKQDSSPKIKS